MSRNVFSDINPAITSGTQLATLLNNFKAALMSGLIGSGRPSATVAGGFWVDDTDDLSGIWKFMLYNGTTDVEVFTINNMTGTASFSGSESLFSIQKISADAAGPVLEFIKERIATSGQVLTGDSIGEIHFLGTRDDGVNVVQAQVSAVSTDDVTASAQGSYLSFQVSADSSAVLSEIARFLSTGVGIGTSSPTEMLHVVGSGIKAEKQSDDAVSSKLKLKKKRVTGLGGVQSADKIATWSMESHDSSGNNIEVANIEAEATQAHTTSVQGTKLTVRTKKTGTNTLANRVIIDADITLDSTLVAPTATITTLTATTANVTTLNATTVNAGSTVEFTDANLLLNDGGNQATANSAVAGFTVEMSDATHARLGYDSTKATKFKLGNLGSEVGIVDETTAQPVTNKSIVTPSRLDVKQDTLANLTTYATTASNGQLVFATDSKVLYQVKDGFLAAVGSGSGVGDTDTLFVQQFDEAQLADFTQTGLTLSTTRLIQGTKTAFIRHSGSITRSFKQVIAIPQKYRGSSINFQTALRTTATKTNVKLTLRDETNSSDLIVQTIPFERIEVVTDTSNISANITVSDASLFNAIRIGSYVSGLGITTANDGTYVTAKSGSTVTLSDTPSTSEIGTTLYFSHLPETYALDVDIPQNCTSMSYLWECLAEANSPTSYFDDIRISLTKEQENKNYFLGGMARFKLYTDTAANIPTDGISSGNLAVGLSFTRSTTTPLSGTSSYQLVQSNSTSLQGKGLSYDFTIDSKDKANVLKVRLSYNASSTFVASNGTTPPLNDGTTSTNAGNSDLEFFILDVTNARLIPLTPQVITANGSNNFIFEAQFQTSDSTSYRLIAHVATTSANATGWTFNFDNIFIGKEAITQGCVITDPVAYTPTFTGFGTVSSVNILSWREGAFLCVRGTFVTGTCTATEARMTLGYNGVSANVTMPSTLPAFSIAQGFYLRAVASTSHGGAVIASPSLTYLTFGNAGTFSNVSLDPLTSPANATSVAGNSDTVSVFAKVPIVGWSSSTVVSNDATNRIIAAQVTGNAASASAGNPIIFPTVKFDRASGYNASTGRYTCPVSGLYRMYGALDSSGNTGVTFIGYVNGVSSGVKAGTSDSNGEVTYATLLETKAGDLIDIRPDGTYDCVSTNCSMNIELVTGPATIAAAESVNASYYCSANFAATTTVPINFDSKEFDSHSSVTPSATVWKFTAPSPGIYNISGYLYVASSAGGNVKIHKNGTAYKTLAIYVNSGSAIEIPVLNADVPLLAGEYIDIRPVNNTTFSGGVLSGDSTSYISIKKVGQYA